MTTPKISVVSPVYQSAETISILIDRLRTVLCAITDAFEIILVDDGSADEGWKIIEQQCAIFPEVNGIRLQQNYGQHTAIYAGIKEAVGEIIIVMDCDLQDMPEDIPELLNKLDTDTEAIYGMRGKKYASAYQRMLSSGFYFLLQLLSGIKLGGGVANFGAYRRKVIDDVCAASYRFFFFPVAVRKVCTHTKAVDVQHAVRVAGRSAYSPAKAAKLALRICLAYSFLSYFYAKRPVQYSIAQRCAFRHDTI